MSLGCILSILPSYHIGSNIRRPKRTTVQIHFQQQSRFSGYCRKSIQLPNFHPQANISCSVGGSTGGSTGDGSLWANLPFFFFLPPFVGIGASNSCSGSVVCSWAYSSLAGCSSRSGLDDLDCLSTDSKSIASTKLQELEDNVAGLFCKLACNSLMDSASKARLGQDDMVNAGDKPPRVKSWKKRNSTEKLYKAVVTASIR